METPTETEKANITAIVAASEKILVEDCERLQELASNKAARFTTAQLNLMLLWAETRHKARIQHWITTGWTPPIEG